MHGRVTRGRCARRGAYWLLQGGLHRKQVPKVPRGSAPPVPRVFGLFGLDLGLGSQSMPGVPGMSVFSRGTVFKMQVYWESS